MFKTLTNPFEHVARKKFSPRSGRSTLPKRRVSVPIASARYDRGSLGISRVNTPSLLEDLDLFRCLASWRVTRAARAGQVSYQTDCGRVLFAAFDDPQQ
jgi:hypothetical protein